MSILIEAVYESGVFKPLIPVPNLKEHEMVWLKLEPPTTTENAVSLSERQRRRRIQIEPSAAREIGDSYEYLV
ncbi:MAG: antitoxin family protein [Blastocatellia bacterium]